MREYGSAFSVEGGLEGGRIMRWSIDVSPAGRRAQGHLLCIVVALAGAGCTAAMPVREVVIYRNGVAYFERGGYVSQSQVRFRMKQGGVSDFLATLAVSEHAGAGPTSPPVHAIDVEDHGGDGSSLETVVLTLDGHPHDLRVGYVGQSPIWKPSYRLILHPNGAANLQVWGIVQNLSGEDWKAIKLSLVASAPVAFQSDLQTPVMPSLPTVTDRGDPTLPLVPGTSGYGYHAAMDQALGASGQVASSTSTSGDAKALARRREQAQMNAAGLAPRNTTAALTVGGPGGTRYDIPSPVTIPYEGSSMVMVLDRPVAAESLLFFAPDPEVPDSATHPFRAVRFLNETGGALEPGPVTIFEDGAFLSQGVLESIPSAGSGTVPLGIEPSVTVASEVRTEQQAGTLTNDGVGGLTIPRTRATRTTYRVTNETAQAVKVLVRHPRTQGAHLLAPAGTEDGVGKVTAIVPATVGARSSMDLAIEDDIPQKDAVDWFTPTADAAVHAYLVGPHADPVVAKKLEAAWAIRNDIVKLMDERDGLRLQQYDWTRKSGAGHSDAASKAASLTHQIEDLDAKIEALKAHFRVALGDIVAPLGM